MDNERFTWSSVGSTYFAVDVKAGRIAALLYWTEGELGGERGAAGDFETYYPGWLWIPAGAPALYDLTTRPLLPEMTASEREVVLEEAFAAVERLLLSIEAGSQS